jgi:DNA-binding NtrC family response regulator
MKSVVYTGEPDLHEKTPGGNPINMRNFQRDAEIFPRHVLVVDDEPLIRWSVTESLSELGCDVEQASDATSALRTVTTSARPFDVVVLDLRLPDMNDLSLLATLRQLLPKSLLILMTAFGTPDVIRDAQELRASVLSKPFELSDLQRLVREPGMDLN